MACLISPSDNMKKCQFLFRGDRGAAKKDWAVRGSPRGLIFIDTVSESIKTTTTTNGTSYSQ